MASRPDNLLDLHGFPDPLPDPDTSLPAFVADRVSVLRPRDLLAFTASWQGLARRKDGGALVAGAKGGTLTITFPFQHVGEDARPLDTDPPLPVPVHARAARPSRLVFAVAAGQSVPYSIEGLLGAMATLPLAVAPAAAGASRVWTWNDVAAKNRGPLVQLLADTARTRVVVAPVAARKGAAQTATPPLASLVAARQAALVVNRVVAAGGLSPGDTLGQVPGRVTTKLPEVRSPNAGETAIEALFRLILSPPADSGWLHATGPVAAVTDLSRVELWHSRLATRVALPTGGTRLDDSPDGQRTVRAIWTRDNDRTAGSFAADPFNGSLNADNRRHIVEQTAGSKRAPKVLPTPIRVRRFALSSLGAFLDLHVQWPWAQYPDGFEPLASWDHVAPMGRDQFVRVVTPGFLYPLGHAAYLVEITQRKIVGDTNPVAELFKRRFLVLGDPHRPYTVRDLPFVSATLAPLRTPDLVVPVDLFKPVAPPSADPADQSGTGPRLFWLQVNGAPPNAPFLWRVTGLDQDGQPIHLRMPMLWVRALAKVPAKTVADEYAKQPGDIDAAGQTIAFAPALDGDGGGRASAEAQTVRFSADMTATEATPHLAGASVIVPAMKRLTPAAPPVRIGYADIYRTQGFGAANKGQVFFELAKDSPTHLSFGSSDRSGGFVQPDVAVRGLARGVGLVADIAQAQAGTFKPQDLFAGAFPKLFGMIDLWEIVADVALDLAPKFLTDELNKATALLRDLQQLQALVSGGELADRAAALAGPLKTAVGDTRTAVDAGVAAFGHLLHGDAGALAAVTEALKDLRGGLAELRTAVPDVPLAPTVRTALDRAMEAVGAVLLVGEEAAGIEAKLQPLFDAIAAFANNLDPGGRELRARMEWRPTIKNWSFPPFTSPVFQVDGDPHGALPLSVETRMAVGKPPVADVAAELSHFSLELLPGAQLMSVKFDRIAFRTTVGRKPEVDVVFGGIDFLGVLGFVNTLAKIVPLDGFSDPPFLDVSTDGIRAGFTLALPNLAIGIFSLSNLAIEADARVPFLGESVTVGFSFCTREKPFTLAVAFLGGGGFFGVRLSPRGLVLLEAAFEFGAVVALDFGVASGSVSAMAGIYFRMEGDAASLTGYFRVRGEVDVLSLISASIELYMALTYAFDTGKMVGEATIKVHVEVLFFSTTVSIHAQRTFAGSNGDPTAEQMLLPENGHSQIWEDYCAAFAPAKVEG